MEASIVTFIFLPTSYLIASSSGRIIFNLLFLIAISSIVTSPNGSFKKILASKLQDIKSANKVKKTLAKRYESRKGGYTRIIKAGYRYGDDAPMAVIELVDRNLQAKKIDKPKKAESAKKDKETLPKTASK